MDNTTNEARGLPLFDPPKRHLETPVAHARRTDPQTSHDAAASVQHISELQLEILRALKQFGPMHDEALVARLTDPEHKGGFNLAATPASIRSRRADLVKRLKLVRPRIEIHEGNEYRRVTRTAAGRLSQVWEAI